MWKLLNRKLSDKEAARRSERWAFWALPLAGISILIAVVFAVRAEHLQLELARRSGSLEKPNPTLRVGGIKVDQPLTIYYAAPFTKNSLTVVNLPLEVQNEGGKTTKGTQVVIREPKISAIETTDLSATAETTLPVNLNAQRHFASLGNYSYSSFLLPDLNPGQNLGIGEPLVVGNSRQEISGKARMQDGVTVSYSASLEFGYPITISISGEDLKTTDYSLEVIGLQATTEAQMNHALADVIEGQVETSNRERTLWSRIVGYILPDHRRALLLMPKFDKHSQPNGGAVYLPNGLQFNRTVEYDVR
ncbi:MAG: hypothetical protein WCA10_05290 [Terracidiphilus sp.]